MLVRISKKKTVLFVIMFLLLVGFVLGILYLKSVADYRQAVRETTDSIVDEQKIDVDAISGATNSSNVIKKRLKTL